MSQWARYWPVGLLLAAVVGLGASVHYRALVSRPARTDFVMLRSAGRAVLDGNDIYAVQHRGWPFYYPPTMAVVMVPFALLPLAPAVLAWYGLGMGAVLWAGYRLVRLNDELSGRQIGPLVVLAFAVNFGPIVSGLQRGQVSTLLFMLMVEAFWCYRRGRSARCGLWIGLAAALKLYPALLVLPLVVRRDRHGLGGFVAGALLLGMVPALTVMGPAAGWDATEHFVRRIAMPFFADRSYAERELFTQFNQFSPSNQSLFGVLARWLASGSLPPGQPFAWSLADLSTGAVRRIGLAVSAALLVVMAVAIWRSGRRTGWSEAVVWCLPMVAANFICHVAWHHYYAVLTVPYALATTALVRSPPGRTRTCLAGALGLALACNWLHFGLMFCRQMGLLLLGSLLLWIVLAVVAVRRPVPEARSGLKSQDDNRLPP